MKTILLLIISCMLIGVVKTQEKKRLIQMQATITYDSVTLEEVAEIEVWLKKAISRFRKPEIKISVTNQPQPVWQNYFRFDSTDWRWKKDDSPFIYSDTLRQW